MAEKSAVLELIKGIDDSGEKFFTYILIRVSELDKIKNKKDSEIIDLAQKGLILYTGPGHDIPEGVEEYVMQEFKKLLKNPE